MSEVVTVPGMADEEFVTRFVELAKAESLAAADAWAASLFEDGVVPAEIVERTKDSAISQLVDAELMNAPVAHSEAAVEAIAEEGTEVAHSNADAAEESSEA